MLIKDLEMSKDLAGDELAAVRGGTTTALAATLGGIYSYSGAQQNGFINVNASPVTNVYAPVAGAYAFEEHYHTALNVLGIQGVSF